MCGVKSKLVVEPLAVTSDPESSVTKLEVISCTIGNLASATPVYKFAPALVSTKFASNWSVNDCTSTPVDAAPVTAALVLKTE